MQHSIIPPAAPGQNDSIRPPMIYIERQANWEYRQVIRNLEQEKPLDEAELKALGEQGWEMTGIIQQSPLAYFYFKRPIEK